MTDAPTTMHIGELAERAGMSLRTIRHYDEVGLLTPSGRSDGGFRLYTEADLERLILIRRMKPLGFSLEEMARLLELVARLETDSGDEEARAALDALRADASQRRERLRMHLEMADEFLGLLSEL